MRLSLCPSQLEERSCCGAAQRTAAPLPPRVARSGALLRLWLSGGARGVVAAAREGASGEVRALSYPFLVFGVVAPRGAACAPWARGWRGPRRGQLVRGRLAVL